MNKIKIIKYPSRTKWAGILRDCKLNCEGNSGDRGASGGSDLQRSVAEILNDVALRGDKAVIDNALKFDKVKLVAA